MKIYFDSDFRCHTDAMSGFREANIDFFDGKCKTFIEGYRFIPSGESWTNSNGVTFYGEMISPAENYRILEKAQLQYEQDEAKRMNDLGIPQEKSFIATSNHSVGSFISIHDIIYEVISTIIDGCTIIIGQDVIEVPIEYYLEKLKEDNNEETDF